MDRPPNLKPPVWTLENPPVPTPEPIAQPDEHGGRKDGMDPTRYGDWESKGMAIDF